MKDNVFEGNSSSWETFSDLLGCFVPMCIKSYVSFQ